MKYEFLSEFTDKKNPTPSYIFDLDLLASHVQKIKELLKGRARICYAMKANPISYQAYEGAGGSVRSVLTWRIQNL